MNVLSLFDGLGGCRIALDKLGIEVNKYYSSEIDKDVIKISSHRYPDIIQLGDVTKINQSMIKGKIDLITAGSPCQDLSIAGSRIGLSEITSLKQYLKLKKSGFKFSGQSYLFWEFIRLVRELKPKYFFLENVRMDDRWKYIITKELGVLPLMINSSVVSIQNRERYYWTNIPSVSHPKTKDIPLSTVIPSAIGGYGKRGVWNEKLKRYVSKGTTRKDGKVNCITTSRGTTGMVMLKNKSIRRLTITEAEVAQTLPKNYTKVPGVSETARWHAIGNGWTIKVIVHLFKGLKK